MAIDKQYIVKLKGKDYPLWAGILNDATNKGLKSLSTTVLQIPSDENGWLAVVMATAEFADGRVFTDVGDCSPKSTTPQLAAAALRIASTRAKGRVLRDAVNVGDTMYEELPDAEQAEAEERPAQLQQDEQPMGYPCEVCNAEVDYQTAGASRRKFNGRVFCIPHGRELMEGMKERGALACKDCGQIVSEKVANAAIQGLGFIRCVDCATRLKAQEKEAVAV